MGNNIVFMANFRNYKVWRKSHNLVINLCRLTDGFPERERYDLTRQIRRSAASIPANIAEGMGKRGDKERGRYVNIAIGSAYELDCHILLARDLGYLSSPDHEVLQSDILEVRKMLAGLHRRLVNPS